MKKSDRNLGYTDPYDPKFYTTTAPKMRLSYLVLTDIVKPPELRLKMHPGYFSQLLYDLLKYDHGPPLRERDPSEHDPYHVWEITEEELVWRWERITKHKIATARHARKKALAYCRALGALDFFYLQSLPPETADEDEPRRYKIQFVQPDVWILKTQKYLINRGYLSHSDCKKLSRMHWFRNVCSWDWVLPNKKRIRIHANGLMQTIRSVPVCARTWANYVNRNVTCHSRAILGGACDYHPLSKKPTKRKAIRDKRCFVDLRTTEVDIATQNEIRERIREKKHAQLVAEVKKAIDSSASTFRTWPVSHEAAAGFHRHSKMTEQRRMNLREMITVIPQALVMGKPVQGNAIGRIKKVRKKHGARPLRFQPIAQRPGWYQPQLDLPNRYAFKKKFENWVLHDVPPQLLCSPTRVKNMHLTHPKEVKTPVECTEIFVTQITEHKCDFAAYNLVRERNKKIRKWNPGLAKDHPSLQATQRDYKDAMVAHTILAPSVINLSYLGDEGNPQMQQELKEAGLAMYPGALRRKKRVPVRGCHHKERTRAKLKMQHEGTWKGTFSLDLLDTTEVDHKRRIAPQTLYRREKTEERRRALAEALRGSGGSQAPSTAGYLVTRTYTDPDSGKQFKIQRELPVFPQPSWGGFDDGRDAPSDGDFDFNEPGFKD